MKVLTISYEEEKGVANFYGNMEPEEAILILFKAAKQGMFKLQNEVNNEDAKID